MQEGYLTDIDGKLRSYGDCLRFLALARPGLLLRYCCISVSKQQAKKKGVGVEGVCQQRL